MQKYIFEEFLGRRLKVLLSSDKTKIGKKGIIINETKNLFLVSDNNQKYTLPKKECIFGIFFDDWIEIDGKDILYRPEERIRFVKKRC